MDVHVGSRRRRDSSPERAKICRLQQKVNPVKKVQVVYYLSRNGLLEHPHYMEVTLSPNEPLRLKDVLDRLIALRGSGMPSLYSWSCKRGYKSGYVWYDLAVNDIIHPAEGAEYVLKGSELVQGCSERFQQLHISNRQVVPQQPSFNLKRKAFTNGSPQREAEEYEEYEEQLEEEYELDGEKTSYTSSTTTPHSRCSRGVSTDELEEDQDQHTRPQNSIATKPTAVNDSPVPPCPCPSTLADKLNQDIHVRANIIKDVKNSSKRFEDRDPVNTGSGPSRNSVLLQFIACGSSAVSKAKNAPCVSNVVKKNQTGVVRGVAPIRSARKLTSEAEMINYMSENPRFGNLQSEEKEYFSGSLVESMKEEHPVSDPVLKKSTSYNEERSSKVVIGEVMEDEKTKKKGGVKGKCIPRKKSSDSSKESNK